MLQIDLFMNVFQILIRIEGEEILLEEPPLVLIFNVNIYDVIYGIVLGVIKLFLFSLYL